jgi:endonuclease/exonuclease/phosphatase (EEP) superfamily protein YafD
MGEHLGVDACRLCAAVTEPHMLLPDPPPERPAVSLRPHTLALAVAGVLAGLLPAASPAGAAEPDRTTGTFLWANAWAAHYTQGRGGAASGAERMRRLIRLASRADVELGALAELERSQITALRRSAPSYRLLVGGRGMTDGVLWDAGAYDLVEGYRFRGFTYGGRRVRVPVAVLRDRSTGRLLAVIAVHNPRDRWNARAYRRQMKEVRRLRRAYARISVFVAGDFNSGSWVACRAHRTRLFSAGHRRCGAQAPIDQLLVDRQVRVSGYRRLDGRRADRITDHPAVYHARFAIGG